MGCIPWRLGALAPWRQKPPKHRGHQVISLGPVVEHLPGWLMVLFRLSGIFLLAPIFGSTAIPRIVKVMLVLGLSLCVYPMLVGKGVTSTGILGSVAGGQVSIWSLASAVAVELLMGYVVGYCASLPLIGMQLSGQIIDQQMGVSAGGVFNPELDAEAGVVGQLLFMSGLAVFLMVGGHHAVMLTLVGSFELVPVGRFAAPGSAVEIGHTLDLVLGLLTVIFEMAIRIAAPMLCILFLLRIAMGFIGRTVPQMNILSVGFIFYIIVGLIVLVVGVGTGLGVFRVTMIETLRAVLRLFST